MTTSNDNGNQQDGLYYDFFRPHLWARRIDSMDDAVDTTFKLFDHMILNVEGFSVEKFAQLLRDADGSDYVQAIESLTGDPSEENIKETSKRIAADFGKVTLGNLSLKLARLVEKQRLPLSTVDTYGRIDFEVRQLLNLYTLCYTINNFFWGGLKREMKATLDNHIHAGTVPPIHSMRECFQEMANDVEIVQRALVQRQRRQDYDDTYEMGSQAKALQVTDKLALMALAPFQHLLPGDFQVNPITYFSRNTHLHRVPYHDGFVLIGLKYDSLPPHIIRRAYENVKLKDLPPLPTFELMMIPHEMGHYIYHHAKQDGQTTIAEWSKKLFDHAWCEEIFADVYGCVITGPLLALSLQALIAYSDDNAVCANDGGHPTAIVRPFLLTEILRVLHELHPDKYPFLKTAYQLNENWATFLRRQAHQVEGNPLDGFCLIAPHDAPKIDVMEVLEGLRPIIYQFAEFLLASTALPYLDAAADMQPSTIPWAAHPVESLHAYDQIMADLTSFEMTQKPMPHTLVDYKHTNQRGLDQYLAGWYDNGPLTIGPHSSLTNNQVEKLYESGGKLEKLNNLSRET